MNTTMTIDELRWWDLTEIAEHDARIFGPTAWTLGYYWAVMAQNGTAMFKAGTTSAGSGLAESDSTKSGSTAEEALAGWVVMSCAGGEADLMTIATTEAARGQGIGRALLDTGLDWARIQGAEVVHLEVDERNASARALYTSHGFEEWGRRPDYYPGADAVLMRARL
ncbi:MAG: GNAT family N-acetyltransferase [Brevibacterium sp.]